MMHFEELDDVTRRCMLQELEAEESASNPYRSKALSSAGRAAFPQLMREAIVSGNEEQLAAALTRADYWLPTETYVRSGIARERKVNIGQAAQRLAITEFSTWYTRGLARRLLDEGVAQCQVYRAAEPKWEPGDCASHEGLVLPVEVVYRGHRARYWPDPGDPTALSVPFGPGCHHSIRRV